MKTQYLASILALGSLAAAKSDARDLSSRRWEQQAAAAQPAAAASMSKRAITSWSPPSTLTKPLEEVWSHTASTYNDFLTYKNYGYDVLVNGNGKLNYCVRWDSSKSVTAAQRAAIKASLQKNLQYWLQGLYGFMGFPYDKIEVDVVGWATNTPSLLQGSTSDINIYTTKDLGGVAECDPRCGRFYQQNNDYSGCPNGASRHYDTTLWLKEGMGFSGFGADDYQQVGSEYFLENIDLPHIFMHEFGHFLALDDFYDWTPTGQSSFIMNAGSATNVTDFDIWMMRDWWRHLEATGRYN